jgi:hypothetical protein
VASLFRLSSAASLAATACSISSSAKANGSGSSFSDFAPELHSLELAKKMRETIVLPEHRVALDDRGVPLGQRHGPLRLQRIDVGRGLIRGGAHA